MLDINTNLSLNKLIYLNSDNFIYINLTSFINNSGLFYFNENNKILI
jgi:hypothetical protein